MITISATFEVITEESAEHGEAAEAGFLWEDRPHTFRELVCLLNGAAPSSSPPEHMRWATVHGWMCPIDGSFTNVSYHPKTDRDLRYLVKAWYAANKRGSR
jgi:hypothetical protein